MSDQLTNQNASSGQNSNSGSANNQTVQEQQSTVAEIIQRQQEAAQAIIRNLGR